MIIRKKRVLSFKANLGDIKPGEKINVYIEVNDDMLDKLLKVGFSGKLSLGEKVLPSGIFGNISLFNAEGKYIKHKNKPKETAYRQALWK